MGPTYARQVLRTQFEMHGNVAVTMCFITGLQVFHFARTLTIRVKSRSYNKNFIGFLVYSTMFEELFMLSKQQERACKPKKLLHERDFRGLQQIRQFYVATTLQPDICATFCSQLIDTTNLFAKLNVNNLHDCCMLDGISDGNSSPQQKMLEFLVRNCRNNKNFHTKSLSEIFL